jgi:hypothetical protein
MNLGTIIRRSLRLGLRLGLGLGARLGLRVGLQLAVVGGRKSLQLALTVAGVGIGVMLLLLTLTLQSGVQGRAERSGWISADAGTPASAPDAALFLSVVDYHGNDAAPGIRAYVAALGPNPPVPPGLERLPGPGEVAASPALRRLLEATPDDQLDDRYPGRVVATIGEAGLAHPDDLVAIIGRTPEQLRQVRSEELETVRGFDALPSSYAFFLAMRAAALTGSVFLLLPVVIFIVMATRVAAAQREQRLAAIRLAGATRSQTAVIAAVETGLAAVVGTALGWAGYEVGRRVMASTMTLQGHRFHSEDLVVTPLPLLLVVAGIPVLATLTGIATTMVALRRLQASQLAAGQRAHHPPSAWRALPFAIGAGGQLVAVPLGLRSIMPLAIITTIIGFVAMGPWLCMLAGRGIARLSRRAPALLAARRAAADPRATFRAVSGVVLAIYVVISFTSLPSASEGEHYGAGAHGMLRPGVVHVLTGGVPEAQVAPLLIGQAVATRFDFVELVESCQQLARMVTLAPECSASPSDDRGIRMQPRLTGSDLPVASVYVPTDGTPAAESRVRTQAANLVPNAIIHTRADQRDTDGEFFAGAGELLLVGLRFMVVVAACSLALGTIAGVLERRRPFALLRASGLRRRELYQVVLLETGVAMLVTSAVAIGLGLVSSYAASLLDEGMVWQWPPASVFSAVGAGVLAALALSAMALPLLDAATRQETVRYE